jgi:flagellin
VGLFSINTNIASLQAQNYLATDENFQNTTINEVTSGLRIVNSGDDAAGLAIANADASNEAVLTQGIQNASDGLSTLQTADSGLSNISQLLDRARTLATESASGAFTGDRGVLNSEFQSVITEVNRQAQAIGLNQGGEFATNLSVFVGGGTASGNISASENGTVSVNLASATVDAKSLGLEGVQASGTAGTDIGDGSTTSVQNILANTSNQSNISNNTTNFTITGPGFSNSNGSNTVKLAVNLTGVTDANTLVTAINAAITNAGNSGSQQATAFANANITAAVNVDSSGKSQLTFNSASTAFQVQGDDQVANAVLGNFSTGAQGVSANVVASGAAFSAPTTTGTVYANISGSGLTGTQGNFTFTSTTANNIATEIAAINTGIAANTTLAATGVKAFQIDSTHIGFEGSAGQSFTVATAGQANGKDGLGSWLSSGTAFNYSSITASTAFASVADAAGSTQDVQVSLNGGATIDLGAVAGGYTAVGDEQTAIDNLNTAFSGNALTRASGLTASDNAGKIEVTSAAGDSFRLNTVGTNDAFGFGVAGVSSAATGSLTSAYAAKTTVNSAGAQSSQNLVNGDAYQFAGLTNAGNAQTITLSAVDAEGNAHSISIGLTTANASTLDQAVSTINSALLASNDSTLEQIAAFKTVGATPAGQSSADEVNGKEGVQFLSAGSQFKVSLGSSQGSATTGVAVGITDGGPSADSGGTDGGAVLTSALNGTGSTADISNIATATAAVNQLGNSVQILGDAQAAVGRGENQFTYATNLANSQLTNLAAAESGIRDANMATESANLTKASIQLQAGIAALAQANSAPQQILKLLQQ